MSNEMMYKIQRYFFESIPKSSSILDFSDFSIISILDKGILYKSCNVSEPLL